MAGSLSLSFSQQLDELGKPLKDGRLYFYQSGTLNPQDAYQDAGLTIKHPYPITLNAAGRIPGFYLADGYIKFRLLDSSGNPKLEGDGQLVIGPSSGGGGGGPGVDATAIFQTGDVMWLDVQGTRAGWVRDNGRTLGNTSSSATERANNDTQGLFIWLYGTYADAVCPVSGGRTGNALNDFNASKTITLPNKKGIIPGGLDDMGAAAGGTLANVPVVSGSVTTAGSIVGETLHTLSAAELAAHTHTVTITYPGHTHAFKGAATNYSNGGNGMQRLADTDPVYGGTNAIQSATTGITAAANANTGGGGAHNTVQRTVLGTFFRKL